MGIGPQQVRRNGLGVDANGEVQGVVDGVLFQFELRVEDVIARGPADDGAVRGHLPFLADGVGVKFVEMVLAQLARAAAG